MSTTYTVTVRCPRCGAAQSAPIVESANVDRHPRFRDEVLAGSFMRVTCAPCGSRFAVERELLYAHLSAGLLIAVFPGLHRARAEELETLFARVCRMTVHDPAAPVVHTVAAEVHCRVVFGYDELREKVLCWARGLDDQALEVLKLQLLVEHRELYRDGFAGLVLVSVDEVALRFHDVSDPPGRPARELTVERADYDRVLAARPRWIVDMAPYLSRPYVNLRRAAGDRALQVA